MTSVIFAMKTSPPNSTKALPHAKNNTAWSVNQKGKLQKPSSNNGNTFSFPQTAEEANKPFSPNINYDIRFWSENNIDEIQFPSIISNNTVQFSSLNKVRNSPKPSSTDQYNFKMMFNSKSDTDSPILI